MIQKSISLIKQLTPPTFAKTSAEKFLADQAAIRRLTWFDVAIIIGMLLDFLSTVIDVYTHWWSVGTAEVFLSLYLVAWLLLSRSMRPLLGRLMLAGLIAGICELFTDASGQYVAHSLIYPAGELTLWTSPAYMPLSWMVILTHLGYLAWRLRAIAGWRKASLICGIWGAMQIPFYEEMAYYGGWWHYVPTRLMLGHTPLYVLLFEGLIIASLPLFYDRIERRAWLQVAIIGVLLGLWMPVVGLASWLLLGH